MISGGSCCYHAHKLRVGGAQAMVPVQGWVRGLHAAGARNVPPQRLCSGLLPARRPGLVLASAGDHIGFCTAALAGMHLAVAMSLRAVWCPDQGPGAFKAEGGQRCSWCPHRCLLRCGLPVSRTSCCCWSLASFCRVSSSSHRCSVGGLGSQPGCAALPVLLQGRGAGEGMQGQGLFSGQQLRCCG